MRMRVVCTIKLLQYKMIYVVNDNSFKFKECIVLLTAATNYFKVFVIGIVAVERIRIII